MSVTTLREALTVELEIHFYTFDDATDVERCSCGCGWPCEYEARLRSALADEAEAPAGGVDPMRTRPDYDLRCQRCGAPHNIDTSVPSSVWNKMVGRDMPEGDRWGVLCTLCIDDLMAEAGLSCEVEFYFVGRAIKSRLYPEAKPLVTALSPDESTRPKPNHPFAPVWKLGHAWDFCGHFSCGQPASAHSEPAGGKA